MDQIEFIEAIKIVVKETAINDIKSMLTNPPGKKTGREKIELSKWYNNLNENDKSFIHTIIRESVEISVFGFLCVLDGVRAIEGREKGELKLYYEKNTLSILLNDFNSEYLHDLFNAV